MNIQIKKGIFFLTLISIFKNKKTFLCCIPIDIIFFASLPILGKIFNLLSLRAGQQIYKLLFLTAVYYLILLFLYSFFKYVVLKLVKSAFETLENSNRNFRRAQKHAPCFSVGVFDKSKFNFSRLGKFYFLNIIVFVVFLLLFFALIFVVTSVKANLAPYVSLLILIVYSAIAYTFLNISHVLFFENRNIAESVKTAFKSLIKINLYYGTYIVTIVPISITILLFSLFGSILKKTVFQDYSNILKYGDTYTVIFVYTFGIILYLAILFNRFYFYNIFKGKFLK